jgi:hypothetical protein
MSLTDLIDKAKELIGGGGVEGLSDKASELSDIAQGEGSVLEKAQEAAQNLGEGGDAGGEGGDSSGGQRG